MVEILYHDESLIFYSLALIPFLPCKRDNSMAFKKTFVLSTEDLNTHGFWVRTSGVSLENAKKNLPAFYNHRTWEEPIGHWENPRVVDNEILADLVIEGADDREKMYIRKIENGDIKGASMGLDPFEWSEDPLALKQGQTRPTLEKSELYEGSITPLPANKASLALKKKQGSVIVLSDEGDLNNIIPNLKPQNDMKQIALKLGLSENATEQEILTKIIELSAKAANAEAMQKVIEEQVTEGLTEDQKAFFVSLSKTNFPEAMKFLSLNKKAEAAEDAPEAGTVAQQPAAKVVKDVKVSTMLNRANAAAASQPSNEGKETFDYLRKHNSAELARIRKDEPEKYAQLAKEYENGVRYKG